MESRNRYAASGLEFLPEPGPVRYSFVAPTAPAWSKIQLLGERHWVHRRFSPDIGGAGHRGQAE